jgi:hypothetical protein
MIGKAGERRTEYGIVRVEEQKGAVPSGCLCWNEGYFQV